MVKAVHRGSPYGGVVQVGAFRLDHPVTRGSSGTVWRGEHRATGRAVAVKFVPFKIGAKDSDIYRFRAEVRSIARIVHPGVVRIYDEGILQRPSEPASRYQEDLSVLEGSPYIVMEWALDGSLAQQPRPSTWSQLATILHSLLEALGASHAHGVIHRDVKPQNILISGDRILLTDFGVAFERDAPGTDANRSHMVGSPNYMAPEQVLTMASTDHGRICTPLDVLAGCSPPVRLHSTQLECDARRAGQNRRPFAHHQRPPRVC